MTPRIVALAVALLALVTLPSWMHSVYYVNVSSQILYSAIFALGLNVIAGYGGLVSLGHAGLFGIAAYATGYMLQAGFGHPVAILTALVVGLASTAVYAVLSLRATGIGFIMITLALGEIIWGWPIAGSASPAATTASTCTAGRSPSVSSSIAGTPFTTRR